MAPELRKRKSATEVQKPNGSTPKAGKRKAAEDASPVSLKKQKAVKKTVVDAKPTKKSTQKPKKQPVEEETLDLSDTSDKEEEEDKEVQELLTKLDSEDEDVTNGDALFKPGQDVGEIPNISKKDKKTKSSGDESGVLYIGRIPHGFYEHEMRQYFEQFGPINKLRLSRNKKTGASKHFAFVEFAEASTAEIVAKTMDNYLLFGHILKCRVIPKDQVHENLFKGANRRFKKVPWNKMAGSRLEKPLSESTWATKVEREQSKRAKKAAKLKEIGYDFEAPDIKAVPAPAAIKPAETDAKAIEDAPTEKEEEKPAETAVEEPDVDVEVKVKSISASKTKGKGKVSKAGKGKKAQA